MLPAAALPAVRLAAGRGSHQLRASYTSKDRGQEEPTGVSLAALGEKSCDVSNAEGRSSWPLALRLIRAGLEPGIMLGRYWLAWSAKPPLHACNNSSTGRGRDASHISTSDDNKLLLAVRRKTWSGQAAQDGLR